jgi:hypothetical protein
LPLDDLSLFDVFSSAKMAMLHASPAGQGSTTSAMSVLTTLSSRETSRWKRLLSLSSPPAHTPSGAAATWLAMHREAPTKKPASLLLRHALFLDVDIEASLDVGQVTSLSTIVMIACISSMASPLK